MPETAIETQHIVAPGMVAPLDIVVKMITGTDSQQIRIQAQRAEILLR
jgi:hypothetical protein